MNEQQSDKILRKKLQQIQMPFDPKAWEQMDAMLNKDRKKRGFLFWWFAGITALAISSGSLYYFTANNSENIVLATQQSHHIQPAENNIEHTTTNKTNRITPTNHAENNDVVHSKNESKPTHTTTANQHNKKNKAANNNLYFTDNFSSRTSKNNHTANTKQASNIITSEEKINAEKEVLVNTYMASIEKIFFDETAMQLIGIEQQTTNNDEADIKAPKKKKVHYALGVSGIIAATTAGRQQDISFFHRKPYYAVGLTHELLFGKRIALTNAFQYGKNYFEISKPVNNIFRNQPEKYTCDITMLNIPLGIKYYFVSKEKIRWYVHAGINNHIRLKENFVFYFDSDTVAPPRNISYESFSGNDVQSMHDYVPAMTSAERSENNTTLVADFSVNKAKRYYMSAYFATGVEYAMKNKWLFFAEPTYQLSMQPVGIQQKRTHHLGIGSGFRFQF